MKTVLLFQFLMGYEGKEAARELPWFVGTSGCQLVPGLDGAQQCLGYREPRVWDHLSCGEVTKCQGLS